MVVQQQLKQVCDDFNLVVFTTDFKSHSDWYMLEQIWTLDKTFFMTCEEEEISFITFNNFIVHLI